jgi:hypothetical protein
LGITLKALRGLNAHYNVDTLAAAFAELRMVARGRGPAAS